MTLAHITSRRGTSAVKNSDIHPLLFCYDSNRLSRTVPATDHVITSLAFCTDEITNKLCGQSTNAQCQLLPRPRLPEDPHSAAFTCPTGTGRAVFLSILPDPSAHSKRFVYLLNTFSIDADHIDESESQPHFTGGSICTWP